MTAVQKFRVNKGAEVDPSLRGRLVALKVRRDPLAVEIAELQNRISNGEPTITPEKIA
ncbi:hypothetical protein [Hyphomicrobium sp. ghe19]|uniref:hypothetical protein n=1 Tax=Hyphomicrobium sp. ghe19 TaxID=2682968 RepID=UPI0030CFDB1E